MGEYKLISVESRKGGVGKTTAALNIGYLLNGDFNRPNASINADKTGKGCLITYSFPSLSVELIENGGVGMLKFAIVEEERANQEKFKRNDQRNLFDEGGYFDLASVGLTSMTIDVK